MIKATGFFEFWCQIGLRLNSSRCGQKAVRTKRAEVPPWGIRPHQQWNAGDIAEICTTLAVESPKESDVCGVIVARRCCESTNGRRQCIPTGFVIGAQVVFV